MKGVRDACPAALQAITFLQNLDQIQHPPNLTDRLATSYASLTSHVSNRNPKRKKNKKNEEE
jgi:hypothetical protein